MSINSWKFFKPLVDFDTSNVKDMSHMFDNCTQFHQLVDFDTSNVTE
jgi:hypothetical protein